MPKEYKHFTPTEGESHRVYVPIQKAGEYPENTEDEIRYVPARLTGKKVRQHTYEVEVSKEFRDLSTFDLKLNSNTVERETSNNLYLHFQKEDIYVKRE